MDTKTFLTQRSELCRRMADRRELQITAAKARWSWLSQSLSTALKLVSGLGTSGAAESIFPKMLFPLAGPLAGALFGIARQKMFGTKKPFWMRFVPFL